jgi:hypothetical protein
MQKKSEDLLNPENCKAYSDLMDSIDRGDYPVNVKSTIKEIKTLHKNREEASLLVDNTPLKTNNAILRNQAYRSRLVAIKMDAYTPCNNLLTRIDMVKKRLLIDFSTFLNEEGLKTINDKNNWTWDSLASAYAITAKYESIIAHCDMVIADIDQAAYALKNTLDTFNIMSRGAH